MADARAQLVGDLEGDLPSVSPGHLDSGHLEPGEFGRGHLDRVTVYAPVQDFLEYVSPAVLERAVGLEAASHEAREKHRLRVEGRDDAPI